ncbi:MAG TPA: tetratricopeptide repeat protein [Steroidobacteraceae bacterium]|nr:tetratricopeptide repeat protein [Steroidobacteraceae bacterium]
MRGETSPIEKAMELHKAGRLAEAEAAYHVLLRQRPNDADALHFLGMLRAHQSRFPAAIELMQRSLKISPNNPHAWNNLANLLLAEGREDEAEAAYTRATHLNPDMAEAWFNLGVLLRRKRRPGDAVVSFRRVLDSNPRFSRAYESLALLLYRMGQPGLAANTYRKWLEVEPDNATARHMVAATSGQDVPERAADKYVVETFDSFAGRFEQILEKLEYAAPRLLAAALAERVRFGENALDILDAGCGTGLCGVLLRSSAKSLVGVDLSPGMLEKARARGIYDELVEAELCAAMRARPAAYDVVNCADTLVYFGALEEAMAAAAACLRPGGVLAFTVEAEPADSSERYRLQSHGRYTHAGDYVRAATTAAGFGEPEIEAVVLRKECGKDVQGHLVVARLPT